MNTFFYRIMVLDRGAPATTDASFEKSLQLRSDTRAVVVADDNYPDPGLYVRDESDNWRFVIPYQRICFGVVFGHDVQVYMNLPFPVTQFPQGATIYRNGVDVTATATQLTPQDNVIYGVIFPRITTQAFGTVKSVNHKNPDMAGDVELLIQDIPGLADALANAGTLKTVNSQLPDAQGNVAIQAQDGSSATGVSLVVDSGAATGIIKLRTIVQGAGIQLGQDAQGNLTLGWQPFPATAAALGAVVVPAGSGISVGTGGDLALLPPTATTIGGVKAGQNVTIASDGTISASGAVQSVSGQNGAVVISTVDNNGATGTSLIANSGATTGTTKLKTLVPGASITLTPDANGNIVIASTNQGSVTAVQSEGPGLSLVDNDGTQGGVAILRSLVPGSNITITQAADGKSLTFAANQVLQPATQTTLGGVIVKAGLGVDTQGNLTLQPPVGVNLGGVTAGTNINITAAGVISASVPVSSVSGQVGEVVIQAGDTSSASGVSLISDSGATTGTIRLRRLVQGQGITLANDANGNLSISSSASGGVTSISAGALGPLTGAVTFSAGPSITLGGSGNNIQISGTGVPEAPNDSNVYARGQGTWVVVPNAASAITSVTGQTGTNAVLLVEANPPANSAIIKSLVAGTNVTLTESGGLVTITAALPAGTVASVNNKTPNASGAVTLVPADLNAVPIAGNVTMTGPLNMGGQVLNGIPAPQNPSDAVPYSFLTAMSIDNGTF